MELSINCRVRLTYRHQPKRISSIAYVYARETREQADIAKVLTFDEARRIAVNVAKLPKLIAAKR